MYKGLKNIGGPNAWTRKCHMPLDPLGSNSTIDAEMGEVSRTLRFWGPVGCGQVLDLVLFIMVIQWKVLCREMSQS